MSKLVWDQSGEKLYETGVEQAAIYPQVSGAYPAGAAWNGLISVTESPSGAEPTALYANNKKYLELMSNEEFGGTIEAYMYPDEFAECNGEKTVVAGVRVKQQTRKAFGLVYKNLVGNDEEGTDHGYKLHLVYGCLAKPSEKTNTTVNDSPEAVTMSWEFSTTPVDANMEIDGVKLKPFAHIELDSNTCTKILDLEKVLYGQDAVEGVGSSGDENYVAPVEAVAARLPLPAEVFTILGWKTPGNA